MFIRAESGRWVNLFHAQTVYVDPDDDEWAVYVYFFGQTEIQLANFDTEYDAQNWLDEQMEKLETFRGQANS